MCSRLGVALAALALPLCLSVAQAQAPARAPAGKPAAGAAQQPPATPPIFPCRTEQETCFLGIVIGSQLAILFTNAQNAQADRPVDVSGADGAKTDLSANAGRVVMLAGSYDPKTGIKGEVVEVASPLVSLSIKAQLGDGSEPPSGAGPKGAQPKGRR
jgi:hypothetical protein